MLTAMVPPTLESKATLWGLIPDKLEASLAMPLRVKFDMTLVRQICSA